MTAFLKKLKVNLNKLLHTGFFSVFFSNVACKVLVFIGGMIIVRVLSKEDYGQYTYIQNCYSMLFLLGDLGCSVATMQFCSEYHKEPEKFHSFFLYGGRSGILFSILTSVLILISPVFYPYRSEEAIHLTQLMCLLPVLTTINQFLLANLRIRLKNNLFAKINIVNTLIHYLVILPMAYVWAVTGAVVSNYVISGLVLGYSLWVSRKELDFWGHKVNLTQGEKKSFLKLAFASQLNNGLDHVLTILDVFLIGLFIGESVVISTYKVATVLPAALAFVPQSVMVYLVPYFARNVSNILWVKDSYKKLILVGCVGNLLITTVGILLGPWIIPLIFGAQYADAVPCFTILMIGYFFSATFRVPTANVLYTQRRVRENIIITVLTGCANCILDVGLILYCGSIGAAWATTLVHIINSALAVGFMCRYLKRSK